LFFFARHHFANSLIVKMGLDGLGAVVTLIELLDRVRLGFFHIDLLIVEFGSDVDRLFWVLRVTEGEAKEGCGRNHGLCRSGSKDRGHGVNNKLIAKDEERG
jgi:hypothetical protein